MNKFWDKAEKCEHKNEYPNYAVSLPCACGGALEIHCKDCGAYVTVLCRCGEQTGMSGWPRVRWRRRAKS